ncbi:MAG: transcriptional repressor [Coriobacteriia bacterium]|nr:transcriptional repressor [Coriobacteriia bacterium]
MAHDRELTDRELRTACGEGRMSHQRLRIVRAADGMAGTFTVEELHLSAKRSVPGLGIATTYRAVTAMASSGTLAVVGERNGRTLYVWCANDEHHHHIICTGCGRVAGIHCPLPEDDALVAVKNAGFTVTRHDLTLYGLCDACRKGGEV